MTIIVGAGLAGVRLAKALDAAWSRERNQEPLVIFGEHGAFDRMALGEWAAGVRTWPTLELTGLRAQTRLVEREVVEIDTNNRTLVDGTGERWTWDRLVLATGTEPVVPLCFEGHTDAVAIASAEGAETLKQRLASPQSVLIVGAGPLGLETAWNLRLAGHQVTIAHRGERLLEPFLDTEGSDAVAEHWRAHGITLTFNSSEISVIEGAGLRVGFRDGHGWSGTLVVLTCGTKPRVGLARAAGLTVSERGVVVDSLGSTSHPAVWAVGDCVVPENETLSGLWAPARESVDRLVAAWTGSKPAPPGRRAPFRLKVDWPVVSWGPPAPEPDLPEYRVREGARFWKAVGTVGSLRFWQVLGPWDALEARVADLEAGQVTLHPVISEVEWPDSHVVCDCHGLDAGTLRRAWAASRDLAALGRTTGAGTSCGSCRARLLALKGNRLTAAERRSKSYHAARWGRWSWADLVSYGINYGMLVSGLLTVVTGVLKMPGWMEAMGIDQRSLPDGANMALSALLDLHDWPGIILTVLALVHVGIHWGQMATFALSWFKKRGKNP